MPCSRTQPAAVLVAPPRNRPSSRGARIAGALGAALAAACDGPQSALAPAGEGAERIADLFAWMAAGAVVVWLLVVGGTWIFVRRRPQPHERGLAVLVLGGGVVVPTVVLTVLLIYGLSMLPPLLAPAAPGGLAVEVAAERWWWRVRYRTAAGEPVDLANELWLPAGRAVDVRLTSPDVVHSFWVPSLGGKMDAVPGRVNRLTLRPTEPGLYRGACAEYCGDSHARMAFHVRVVTDVEFERWLEHQARPAAAPAGELAARGAHVFRASGCGACHAVRGTPADGRVGPDLTHVGGRAGLAAATLPNDRAAFRRWLERPRAYKPEVHMPAFGMLPARDLAALAAYLDGLE